MEDSIIKGITQVANHKKITEEIEPNVMYHKEITTSETKRILLALKLFREGIDNWQEKNQPVDNEEQKV